MIDPISSIASYIMSRSEASMSIEKYRIEAEAAMARAILDAAENIQRMTEGSTGSSTGSNIDIYV